MTLYPYSPVQYRTNFYDTPFFAAKPHQINAFIIQLFSPALDHAGNWNHAPAMNLDPRRIRIVWYARVLVMSKG